VRRGRREYRGSKVSKVRKEKQALKELRVLRALKVLTRRYKAPRAPKVTKAPPEHRVSPGYRAQLELRAYKVPPGSRGFRAMLRRFLGHKGT
jgi:hypothetical protein